MWHPTVRLLAAAAAVVSSVAAGIAPSAAERVGGSGRPAIRQVAAATPVAEPTPAPTAEPTPTTTASARPTPGTRPALGDAELRRLGVDELGRVPIVEWHDIGEQDTRWDTSLDTFKRQIAELHRRGYRPVTVAEFADGVFPIPAGLSPVMLTFDDSFRSHLHFDASGRPHPDSVVGVLEAFARRHSDWRAIATFYLFWPRPFREAGQVERKITWLAEHGYELGNHSYNHDDLSAMTDDEVRRSLADLQREVAEIVPGFRFRSLALPFGLWPGDRSLAVEGSWEGEHYRHDVILLVGDMPNVPVYHVDYDPTQVMRVQSFELRKWLAWLDHGRRFVSDGDPDVVTYPASAADQARPAPRVIRIYDDR